MRLASALGVPPGSRVRIARITDSDVPALRAAMEQSRDRIAPWGPIGVDGVEGLPALQSASNVTMLVHALDPEGGHGIVGRVNVVSIVRGRGQLATLGYDAYEDLARRLATLGNQAGYERALTSLAEPAPNQAEGHRRLGRAFTRDGRLEAALVQWAQVVRTERLDPTGWLEYAESAVRAGDTATARKALQHVLEGTWEDRFGDVKQQAAARLARLPS